MTAQIYPPIYHQRVSTARRRIRAILRRRPVAYFRELERQVCEVGFDFKTAPQSQRPEPVHFNVALKQAIAAGELQPAITAPVLGQQARFYALADLPDPELAAALGDKIAHVTAYQRVERIPAVSGHHAESIHHSAMTASAGWRSVGWQAGVPITRLHDRTVSVGDVDLAGFYLPTDTACVAQVKNGREWVYETDDVVWHLFGAAAELGAVPILIARRVPETTFNFMKLTGGFAFRAVKMILPPEAQAMAEPGQPTFMEALTDLDFHTDVDFLPPGAPLARHRALWDSALPPRLDEMRARFEAIHDDVMRIAFAEGLRDERVRLGRATRRARKTIVDELLDRLG